MAPPVPTTDQTITSLSDTIKRCSATFFWNGQNVDVNNQYLLIFRLEGWGFGPPVAQFFVGDTFVLDVELPAPGYNDVAILLDCPGPGWVYCTVRLAVADTTAHPYSGFFFKGVDCYLI